MARQTWEVESQKILDNKLPIFAICTQIKNVCFLQSPSIVAADAHSKGLTMVTVGADVDLVKGSVGWEMPSEPAKAITLKKIENLVQNSDGLLAPINAHI